MPLLRIAPIDVVLVGVCSMFGIAWCSASSGVLSVSVALTVFALFGTFYAAGTLACSWTQLWGDIPQSFPLKLLVGYAVINTVLFAVAWFHLPALRVAFLGLAACALVALAVGARAGGPPATEGSGTGASARAVVLSLIAATLWAQDSIWATDVVADATVFRPWVDSFFHAAQVAEMSGSRGGDRMQDVQFAFFPARFYHYAPYVISALANGLSSVTAYEAYGAVLVPTGILMTGAAAYVLVSLWWGAWPGFFAAAALLLLPDASTQGAGNDFLSYHWMQNVGPAGMYGVAMLALAWTLVLRGCERSSGLQVIAGWIVGACTVLYKAQFFVAAALLLWIYPPLTMRGVGKRTRALWLCFAVFVYGAAVWVANTFPWFPGMWLDFSATSDFLQLLLNSARPGAFTALFAPRLRPEAGLPSLVFYGAPYVLGCALGVFSLAYAGLAFKRAKHIEPRLLAFPLLVILNFLVMALGLAYGNPGVGSREELVHRPFVWAYFVTVAWVGGAAAAACAPHFRHLRSRVLAAVVLAMLFIVPARRGAAGIQHKSVWSLARVSVPTAYVDLARFLRTHSDPTDVIQDSQGDPYMVLTGLSERRPFTIRFWLETQYASDEAMSRADRIAGLFLAEDAESITEAARGLGVTWVILNPNDIVGWPAAVLERPAFASGGYRAYRVAEALTGP